MRKRLFAALTAIALLLPGTASAARTPPSDIDIRMGRPTFFTGLLCEDQSLAEAMIAVMRHGGLRLVVRFLSEISMPCSMNMWRIIPQEVVVTDHGFRIVSVYFVHDIVRGDSPVYAIVPPIHLERQFYDREEDYRGQWFTPNYNKRR